MSFAYSTAIFVAELPFVTAFALLFQWYAPHTRGFLETAMIAAHNCFVVSCTYWMVGMNTDSGTVAHYMLTAVLEALAFTSLGQMLVSVLPNKQVAQIVSGFMLSMFNLFGGYDCCATYFVPPRAFASHHHTSTQILRPGAKHGQGRAMVVLVQPSRVCLPCVVVAAVSLRRGHLPDYSCGDFPWCWHRQCVGSHGELPWLQLRQPLGNDVGTPRVYCWVPHHHRPRPGFHQSLEALA